MRAGEKVAAFHVGAHKTGTSVFQQYLHRNRRLLRRKRVLVVGRTEPAGYVGWGERLRRSPVANVLIGSCENLLGRPFPKGGDGSLYPAAPRNIEALGRATTGVRGTAILAIRPQEEFLLSADPFLQCRLRAAGPFVRRTEARIARADVLGAYARANRLLFETYLPELPADSYADDAATARLATLLSPRRCRN